MLGDNIRYLRIKQGYSQEYIAERLGYKSYTTIQKWESGVSEPPVKKLKELSILLNADIDDIANKDLLAEESALSAMEGKKSVVINVLGRVAAGIPLETAEEIIDTEEITEEMAQTGSFFGLKIHDDSMQPRICNGDVVIVRQQDDAETGNIVITLVNGEDATCKRLRKCHDGIELIANNPAYESMFFSNEEIINKPVRIIGKVVELRAKF